MATMKPKYPGLNLSAFTGIEEKFEAVFNYLQITTVFCELEGVPNLNPLKTEKDVVTKITVPKGDTGYILLLTKEIRITLTEAIDIYLEEIDTALFEMIQTLKKLEGRCVLQGKMHDIYNTMEYDPGRILYPTYVDSKPINLYFDNLIFSEIAKNNLIDHFHIRQEFYKAMTETINTKIADLSELPDFAKQPYIWDAESAKYEIAELLYALLGTRIQMKQGEKGAHAKLVKNFYNLFGFDDGGYYSKQQQITKRKDKESWLHELTRFIDDVQKRNKPAKKSDSN